MERRLAAILAADVVGFSRLMGEDEAGTLAQLKKLRAELIDQTIAEHRGRIFKLTGDGILAEFPSVVNAVACATDWQRAISPNDRLQFRIGINLGDVVVEGDDIYGGGVNVAVRLESIAPSGGISLSQSVRDQVGNRLDLSFADRGEQNLKNIERPVRVYDVVAKQTAAVTTDRTPDERASIAVLPFTNMSGDTEQEYFSDGMSEDIITDLSKISGLRVVARHSAFSYKGKPIKVQEVGRELGVTHVLEGSVRKAGARVRVSAQLVDCGNSSHIWAERFDRDLTDTFAIQDEITHAIVEQLKIQLLPQEAASIKQPATHSIDAYNFYLKGRDFLRRRSRRYLQLAREMFTKAVEIDPKYARAYAGIALCDSFLFMTYHADVPVDKILASAAQALAIDERLAEAHAARGVALSAAQRYEEAGAEFEQALALDPASADTYYFFARSNFMQGKMEKAAELFERATTIDPDDYQSPCLLVGVYQTLHRHDDAKRIARIGIERADRELALHPEDSRPAQIGSGALVALGDRERAREWTARALAIDPDDLVAQYNAACSYSMLGEIDLALDWLERCLPKLGHEKVQWARNDSDLEALRGTERYAKLFRQVDAQPKF